MPRLVPVCFPTCGWLSALATVWLMEVASANTSGQILLLETRTSCPYDRSHLSLICLHVYCVCRREGKIEMKLTRARHQSNRYIWRKSDIKEREKDSSINGLFFSNWICDGEAPFELLEFDPLRYGNWATLDYALQKELDTVCKIYLNKYCILHV